MERTPTLVLLYGLPTAITVLILALSMKIVGVSSNPVRGVGAATVYTATVWGAINAGWMAHWLLTLRWSQAEVGDWLNKNLPPQSVIIGDVGAGLGLAHRFQAVNVIPGLCNDKHPVEGLQGRPRYIVVLDGSTSERYWNENYPDIVRPQRRIYSSRVLNWQVGVFPVDEREEQ